MEKNNEIKNKLIEQFRDLGGNYKKNDKTEALIKKVHKHLKISGAVDYQLLDILKLLEVYREEVLHDEEFEKFSEKVSSIVNRLIYTNIQDWNINDMRISQATVTYVGNFKDVHILAKKL